MYIYTSALKKSIDTWLPFHYESAFITLDHVNIRQRSCCSWRPFQTHSLHFVTSRLFFFLNKKTHLLTNSITKRTVLSILFQEEGRNY